MVSRVFRWLRRTLYCVVAALVIFIGVRAWESQRGDPLELWHTFVPHELSIEELDRADWAVYLKAEDEIFASVRREVTDKLKPAERVPVNRYFRGSPVYPEGFARDWNRSYELAPEGPPVGAVVLLHGLTDSPYSLRHVAQSYQAHGYLTIAIRIPGHGTVPAGLTDIAWEKWAAATRLAMREARSRVGPSLPVQMVGFSNGGALALDYALDSLEDATLARPERLILISPMIGITEFARFVGIAAVPAFFPAFAKAAWLGIVPEFNPFKYNSFPVNGARQSSLLSRALQQKIARLANAGKLVDLPPALTFQSVIDFTVSTRAIITAFYSRLPANGSELVLFDLNRSVKFGPLLSTASDSVLTRVLPPAPRTFRTTVITNADGGASEVVARTVDAGATTEQVRDLGLVYPSDVFSLSHVALPFPTSDGLYGSNPDQTENFGVQLGALAPRGERGALVISLDSLLRQSSNPFYPYMLQRIEEGMTSRKTAEATAP